VETRKRVGCPWEYLVYLEFAGDAADVPGAAALAEIGGRAAAVHLVGSYPPGRCARARLHPRQSSTVV
jgi:prephenate dehydratase